MLILKILGAIDLFSAIVFLMIVFGMDVLAGFVIFSAILLLVKGLFIIGGDVLSFIDIFSSVILFVSLFFIPFTFLIWMCALLLFAKGFVSLF